MGLKVMERLRKLLEDDPVAGVDVLESARAGFELIDLLQGYRRAIIVDCLDLPDPRPGNVRRLSLTDFAGSVRLNSVHDVNIATAFEFARKVGIHMPEEVEIYAVEGGDLRTISERMTPEVAAAAEPLAREIHERLRSLSG